MAVFLITSYLKGLSMVFSFSRGVKVTLRSVADFI